MVLRLTPCQRFDTGSRSQRKIEHPVDVDLFRHCVELSIAHVGAGWRKLRQVGPSILGV